VFDEAKAKAYFLERVEGLGLGVSRAKLAIALQEKGSATPRARNLYAEGGGVPTTASFGSTSDATGEADTSTVNVDPKVEQIVGSYGAFFHHLGYGSMMSPTRAFGGDVELEVTPALNPTPALFLVEVYGVSSFLGDYGLGRTIRTFTLLPGEETMISVKTWRSTSTKESEASSIIDSFQSKAAEKFRSALQRETTDKQSDSNNHMWKVEADYHGDFGVHKVNVAAEGSGDYHASREQFARQTGEAVQEHANEANAARELKVTSNSEVEVKTGEETVIQRTIKNINLRRT
jgi:hypothetical protein